MVDSEYEGDLSDSKDWIRFTLQDTDSTDFILSDTEINSALDLYSDDKYRAAIMLARGLAAKFSMMGNRRIGPLSIDYSGTVNFYNGLADRLEREVSVAFAAPDEEMSDYDNIFTLDTHAPGSSDTETDEETSISVMRRDHYDADNDGVVDTAEGVREVTEFPDNPKKGDIVMKDNQLYVCTEVDD